MRISCDENDPGYHNWLKLRSDAGAWNKVLLDGKEIKDVITADDERGYVLRYVRSLTGNIRVDYGAKKAITEELHGKVEIVMIGGCHGA